jgi:CheY-like chemotaxis protein
MLKIPRIAVFRPHEAETSQIAALFQRHEYSVRTVGSAAEIQSLIEEEAAPFDCVVIPPRMEGSAGGMPLCLQVKTQESLAAIPIVALVASKDRALIQSLYSSGVDVVMPAPFDPDMLYLQIGALCRTKRAFDELLQHHYEDSGMRQSSIAAFNSIREGLVIFDRDCNITFINSPGATLIGVKSNHTMEEIEQSAQQFATLIGKHEEARRKLSPDDLALDLSSTFNLQVERLDRRSFKAEARVATLQSKDQQTVGFSVAFSDMSGVVQLAELLSLAQRTRTLSLLTCAGSLHLLSTKTGNPSSSLQALQSALQEEAPVAQLGKVVTFLLEVLDQILSSEINVKVKIKQDWKLAVRMSDLLQIVGHFAILAAENSVLGGEITLDAEENSEGNYLELAVTSQAETRIRYLQDDIASSVIDGSLSTAKNSQGRQPPAFAAAQSIAASYGGKAQVRKISASEIQLIAALPLAAK